MRLTLAVDGACGQGIVGVRGLILNPPHIVYSWKFGCIVWPWAPDATCKRGWLREWC